MLTFRKFRLRVWDELGYRTEVKSPTWRVQLYGRAQDFDEKAFRKTLSDLLRHVNESGTKILAFLVQKYKY
jgi:hypothetical protein